MGRGRRAQRRRGDLEREMAARRAVRAAYQEALARATTEPVGADANAALHAWLTLNAAYFLGEWFTPASHLALVARLAEQVSGVLSLALPLDAAHAAQLAQHARELAAELGPSAWTTT